MSQIFFVGENNESINSQHLLISMLLPSAVKMFKKELESEVEQLCGARSKHGGENVRWGKQNGSIVLGNQHVALEKTRVRDRAGKEVNLKTYEDFMNLPRFSGHITERFSLRNVSPLWQRQEGTQPSIKSRPFV